MNVFLWVLQAVLGVFSLAGGTYKVLMAAELAGQLPLSRPGWAALGVLEVVCAVLLVVPAALNWMPVLTPLAAAALALDYLALAVLFARYSIKLTANNPLPYALVGGLLAAFVDYGRYAFSP
jgi:hypothetical protein